MFASLANLVVIVALAYHLQKYPHVFPILGGNKIEQLQSNLKSLTVRLSDEQIAEIEAAVPFDIGYPLARIVREMPLPCFPNAYHSAGRTPRAIHAAPPLRPLPGHPGSPADSP